MEHFEPLNIQQYSIIITRFGSNLSYVRPSRLEAVLGLHASIDQRYPVVSPVHHLATFLSFRKDVAQERKEQVQVSETK